MNSITLVCTDHKERSGECTSYELCRLIDQISPDIIFEEIHIDLHTGYYDGTYLSTLETKAISLYLQQKRIKHVPVDRYDLDLVHPEYFNPIYAEVDRFNSNHNKLWLTHIALMQRMGFAYLNSDQCTEILLNKRLLVEKVLKELNNSELLYRHNKWIEVLDNRENEMIKNIYNYKDLSSHSKGLFFIGAEHRKSIIEKVAIYEVNTNQKLNWVFNYF